MHQIGHRHSQKIIEMPVEELGVNDLDDGLDRYDHRPTAN